jgi:hypothetical protein
VWSVPHPRLDRGDEDVAQQILRRGRTHSSGEEAEHRHRVALVQRAERLRPEPGPREQLVVGRLVHLHTPPMREVAHV